MADRRSRAPLGAGIAGLVLAALLAPGAPLPLSIELRWFTAFLLFVLLPGWLLVSTPFVADSVYEVTSVPVQVFRSKVPTGAAASSSWKFTTCPESEQFSMRAEG